MEVFGFLKDNWFSLVQSAGIIASLLFTAISMRNDTKSRHVGNLMAITQGHREIWNRFYERPELARVLDPEADLENYPVHEWEEVFVRSLILHLNSSYQAIRTKLILKPEGLEKELSWFFSLPIPRHVWRQVRPFQDRAFVSFVEATVTKRSKL